MKSMQRQPTFCLSPYSEFDLPIAFWLSVTVSLAVLPHVLHLPIWIGILFLSVIATRLLLQGYQSRMWMRVLIAMLALSSGLGVYFQYGTLLGRDAGVAMLVIAAGFKLLEAYRLRDAVISIFLVYFVVVTNFLYTQSITMALYMLGVVAVTTMLLIQLNQCGDSPGWRKKLWRTGSMLLRSVPFFIVLFLLFPRINGPLWSLGTGGSGVSGLSDEMNPGDITQLVRSAEVAFRVTFDGTPPARSLLYWRGPVLSSFDGKTWRAYERRARLPSASYGENRFSYEVVLEPHDKAWLFALDLAIAAPTGAYFNPDHQLIAREVVNERWHYRVSSSLDYTLGSGLSTQERSHYLSLPRKPSPRIRALVNKWRLLDNDAQDIANRVLAYFHEQPFIYSLTPPRLVGDQIDRFLFETRKGFCGHYASSFVVLMRTAGIPARVVTGYQGGEWNPLGDYMLVRQSDAHAWAEIWIEERGWVRVDPTAAVSPARVELGIANAPGISEAMPMFSGMVYSVRWINRLSLAWDTLSFRWHEWVIAYGPQRQQALLSTLGIEDSGWMPLVVLMGVIIVIIVFLYALIFVCSNRPPRPDPVVREYSKFRRKMTAVGLEQFTHEGAIDYARRVIQKRPELADEVKGITALYSALRYGALKRERELNELKRRVRSLKV